MDGWHGLKDPLRSSFPRGVCYLFSHLLSPLSPPFPPPPLPVSLLLSRYMVRRRDEGWLQGFISVTTFTTWQKWFKWDSSVFDRHELQAAGRRYDTDGGLASALEAQERHGNPEKEGVIWRRVGEVSLLGALRCGHWLVRMAIQQFEQSGDYDILVLQATDQSIPFYERLGFTRVGASARCVTVGQS